MIVNFKSQRTEDIYNGKLSRHAKSVPLTLHSKICRLLDQINVVSEVEALRNPPGNNLKRLSGNLRHYWSIRINKQYRLIFKWVNGAAYDVSIEDYH